MLQTNTAKEIFYIFLWLAGIIFLYALVYTFILEPSSGDHTATHPKHLVTSDAHQSTTQANTVHTASEAKIHVVEAVEAPKAVTPVTVTKVTHKIKKLAINNKVPTSTTETVKVTDKKKMVETVKKEVKASVETPMVNSIDEKTKSTKAQVEVEKVTQSSTNTVSTPSVPQAVSIPKHTISIPSTPSVPSVPTMPNSEKIEKVEVQKTTVKLKEETQKKEKTVVPTKELKKVLSRDEEMKLIETARQHVIEKAEAAREEAMKSLER